MFKFIKNNLKKGLKRTRDNMLGGMANMLLGEKVIDDKLLEEIETRLLTADVGVAATKEIIAELTARIARRELANSKALFLALKEYLMELLEPCEQELTINATVKPYVILMVGVNGSGKTTTIGKLAKQLQKNGQKVMLAAGDTFRAAAIEQLDIWGERNKITVIKQHIGADSAAVIYDACSAARARGIDVLLADTAGRLHTQDNLMQELAKVTKVLQKLDATAPHEVMLVLDASIGQNALVQAEEFSKAVKVSGITITKLDGTAKGGIIFAVAKKLGLPIRFIGVGEAIDDLKPFKAKEFVDALFAVE